MDKKKVIILLILIIIGVILIININNSKKNILKIDKVEVDLYFSTKDAMYLKAEKRLVMADNLYENTITELIEGPLSSELAPTIPNDVELLDLSIDSGIVYLSFNQALVENHWGGSTGESLTVYSLVNTISQISGIDRVQILIEGKEIETLAGHLDLVSPLEANEMIVEK